MLPWESAGLQKKKHELASGHGHFLLTSHRSRNKGRRQRRTLGLLRSHRTWVASATANDGLSKGVSMGWVKG